MFLILFFAKKKKLSTKHRIRWSAQQMCVTILNLIWNLLGEIF